MSVFFPQFITKVLDTTKVFIIFYNGNDINPR